MQFTMYDQFTELVLSRGIEAAADYAIEHGFSAVEFLGTVHSPVKTVEEATYARRVLEDRGLTVACYSVGTTLYESVGEEQKLLAHAELAAALGSPFLHHTLASALYLPAGSPDFETVKADVVPRALRIARYAATLGLTCLYEEQGFYFNGVKNFGAFYREMKAQADNVGVCGDLGNILFADEDPECFIRTFASDIRHVHIKDYKVTRESMGASSMRSQGGRFLTEIPVGEGDAHVATCLSILRETGYRGHTALELSFAFPDEYEVVVKKNMAYLQGLFK